MKKPCAVSLYFAGFLAVSIGRAADLKQSKFTQVVNDVEVISAADNSQKAAAVNDIFNLPDLVRTGDASRAELVAADKTITRVGANTIFSFDPADRTIDLRQGSLLFHSPKGKGGGTIRTSSATASVLGTTIIVTTTHNGGFKVIDLEGHVAIKFLNGLRQDLNPGQMTFVLPGGRPAPVITIRLDTLTKNSRLVQGFEQPLPSLPLIQQQVATQVKLIESGQAQDTGLLVGDEATSTSVQVVHVDPTLIQANQTSGVPPNAITINSPTLDPAFITHDSVTLNIGPTAITLFSAPDATPNIIVNTPAIDLSPYAGQSPLFEFWAPDNLTLNGSVAFNGNFALLELGAGNQLSIASGSTVAADVVSFELLANGPNGMTLNGVNILNNDPMGDLEIDSPSLMINGGSLQAPITIALSGGNIALNNPALIKTGFLFINATGSIMVNGGNDGGHGGGGGNFQVGNVTLNAGDGILLNGGSANPVAGPAQLFTFNMTAANLLQVQNLDFGGFQTVNLTAHTINLTNIDFSNGSNVSLASHFGVLNVGSSVPGDVNFVSNVTYGGPGQPAQNHIVSPAAPGTGITITGGVP
jgi:hypothetical protein